MRHIKGVGKGRIGQILNGPTRRGRAVRLAESLRHNHRVRAETQVMFSVGSAGYSSNRGEGGCRAGCFACVCLWLRRRSQQQVPLYLHRPRRKPRRSLSASMETRLVDYTDVPINLFDDIVEHPLQRDRRASTSSATHCCSAVTGGCPAPRTSGVPTPVIIGHYMGLLDTCAPVRSADIRARPT